MTPTDEPDTLVALVAAYANIIGRYGPGHPKSRQFREDHAGNDEFLEYAFALDHVKLALGGSGIDYPPGKEIAAS